LGTRGPSVSSASTGTSSPIIPEVSWEEHEKAKILEALQRSNWNITRAAQLLGMTFRTLQYRLEKFGIKRP
jgi:transcriptional regulator with GAF, ATPase, and Fis domain